MLNKIEKLSETEFVEVFANIFERASWIAEELYERKPFENFQDLSKKMISIFENTNNQNKLKILNSHPDLADKTKIGSLTLDSSREQSDAGLDQCSEKKLVKKASEGKCQPKAGKLGGNNEKLGIKRRVPAEGWRNHSSYFKLHQYLDHGSTPIRGGWKLNCLKSSDFEELFCRISMNISSF